MVDVIKTKLDKLQRIMNWKVVFVYDAESNLGTPYDVIRDALSGGSDAVIYRDKQSTFEEQIAVVKRLLPLVKEYNACLFICDNPYLVYETGCDGVILGQNDIPVAVARDVLGENGIIGLSVHHCGESAESLLYDADFLLMGPIDRSFSGRDPISMQDLSWTTLASRVPVFVYGLSPTNESVFVCLEKKACGVVLIYDGVQDDVVSAVESVVASVTLKKNSLHPDEPCGDNRCDDSQDS